MCGGMFKGGASHKHEHTEVKEQANHSSKTGLLTTYLYAHRPVHTPPWKWMLAEETDGKTTGRQRDEEMCVRHVNITDIDRGINIVCLYYSDFKSSHHSASFFMHNWWSIDEMMQLRSESLKQLFQPQNML